jgi:hypothetical protein
MEQIAIDLGAKESQVCVRSEGGEIVEERGSRRDRRRYGATWKGGPRAGDRGYRGRSKSKPRIRGRPGSW